MQIKFFFIAILFSFFYTHVGFSKAIFSIEDAVISAKSGDAISAYNIATIFIERGDIKKGFYWLNKSADSNYPPAQKTIGLYYETGQYVEQDSKKAFSWYKKAAQNGNTFSIKKVIFFYRKGKGTNINFKKAYIWSMVYSLIIHPNSVNGKKNKIVLNSIMEKLTLDEIKKSNFELLNDYWELVNLDSNCTTRNVNGCNMKKCTNFGDTNSR